MSRSESCVTVTVGDGVVTLRRSGQSSPITANILGLEAGADGQPTRIWLDRLVHRDRDGFVGWRARGAVATELARTTGPR